MPITIPTVAYDGTTPDPVEWANDYVKLAIEELQDSAAGDVQFSVAMLNGGASVSASSFSTFPLDGVPTVNIGGGSWNTGTYIYTIPETGLYLCLAGIRLSDNGAERSVAIGIGTTNADASFVEWQTMGENPAQTIPDERSGRQYTRLARFTAGDLVRLFIYSDGVSFSIAVDGSFMSLTKLAD